jgi:predicted GNAT family acetyltransferase
VFPEGARTPGDAVSLSDERGIAFHPELLLRGWLPAAETPPYFGVVRDGQVVSVCYSARSGPEAAEAGVETAAAYRGQGLAAIATAAWGAAVRHSGRLALYSTAWENKASQGVARKLGLLLYGEDFHIT